MAQLHWNDCRVQANYPAKVQANTPAKVQANYPAKVILPCREASCKGIVLTGRLAVLYWYTQAWFGGFIRHDLLLRTGGAVSGGDMSPAPQMEKILIAVREAISSLSIRLLRKRAGRNDRF
jgi:hypothetical protein